MTKIIPEVENENIESKLPTLELDGKEVSVISIKSNSSENSKFYSSLEITKDIMDAIMYV